MAFDPAEPVRLGASSVVISRLGLGTAAFGRRDRHREVDGPAIVRRALELGIGHVDTAPMYGHGTAEREVGAALEGVDRGSLVLSTKVGRPIRSLGFGTRAASLVREGILGGPAGLRQIGDRARSFATRLATRDGGGPRLRWQSTTTDRDFSYDGVLRSIDESLGRLGVDRLDLLFLHEPTGPVDGIVAGAGRALRRLRDEGVVGAIGIGDNDGAAIAAYLPALEVDCVLLGYQYTLLDQTAATSLLPEARRRGIPVLLGGPFASGILADRELAGPYDYGPVTPRLARRILRLRLVCDRHDVPVRAAAIQFPLRHPAVASVIVGAASIAELEESVAALARPIASAFWEDLEAEGLTEPVPMAPTAG